MQILVYERTRPLQKLKIKLYQLILLVPLALILGGCSDNLLPFNVATKYLQNENANSFTDNYDLLTADSQLKIGRTEYATRLNQARQDAGIVSISIVRVENNPTTVGNRATVPYQLEVTLQNGQKLPVFESLVMLHQDNGWRVVWPPQ